jgi:hypothetical protein
VREGIVPLLLTHPPTFTHFHSCAECVQAYVPAPATTGRCPLFLISSSGTIQRGCTAYFSLML